MGKKCKIILEKKQPPVQVDINDSLNESQYAGLLRDDITESNPKRLTSDLDNDEEYENRKGVASIFQKLFRKKRPQ